MQGDPLTELVALDTDDVAAMVVGASSRADGHQRLGHLAVELADRVSKPLLVVPPRGRPAGRVERVIIALEGQPQRAKPLAQAVQVVAGAELDLTVVHVDSRPPAFSDSAAHETAEYAQEYLMRYWPLAPRARLSLPVGPVADEILAVADDRQPDLIVAGWPQGAGPEHGHVVRELLCRSPYPVLLVAVA